jgi:hypothetical protein
MITERAMLPTAWRFLARRLNGAIHLFFAAAIALTILGIGLVRAGIQSETLADNSQPAGDPDWSELIASMDKMHVAMGAVERSGNSDVDFVRLMLPTIRRRLTWQKRSSFTARIRKCADSRRKSSPISN